MRHQLARHREYFLLYCQIRGRIELTDDMPAGRVPIYTSPYADGPLKGEPVTKREGS